MLGLAAPYGKDHLGHEVCIFFFLFSMLCPVWWGAGVQPLCPHSQRIATSRIEANHQGVVPEGPSHSHPNSLV